MRSRRDYGKYNRQTPDYSDNTFPQKAVIVLLVYVLILLGIKWVIAVYHFITGTL